MILRLAVLLNRSRNATELPKVTFSVDEKSLSLGFDADWLAENPLTVADLERERGFLEQVGYNLTLR